MNKELQKIIDNCGFIPSQFGMDAIVAAYEAGKRAATPAKRRPLIGLTGKAGCGKDTAAAALTEYRRESFAGPLKSMLCAAGILTRAQIEDRELKEKTLDWCDRSPRQLMQTLGTEWGRAQDPDFWVKLAERNLRDEPTVFTDVRFENEADFIRRNGGLVIHIQRGEVSPVSAHVSECGVRYNDDCDAWIINNGAIADLQSHVRHTCLGWYRP